MNLIVAVDKNWAIGRDGDQLIYIPEDLKHFKALTTGHPVILGRKTLATFPGGRPLKGRHNIVVSRQAITIEGAELVHSTEEALAAAARQARCLVIGGASVYRQFMPYVDTVHITKIDLAPQSDSFFPNLDADPCWQRLEEEQWQEEDGLRYCFLTYKKIT